MCAKNWHRILNAIWICMNGWFDWFRVFDESSRLILVAAGCSTLNIISAGLTSLFLISSIISHLLVQSIKYKIKKKWVHASYTIWLVQYNILCYPIHHSYKDRKGDPPNLPPNLPQYSFRWRSLNVHSRPSTVRQGWVPDWWLSQAAASMRFHTLRFTPSGSVPSDNIISQQIPSENSHL